MTPEQLIPLIVIAAVVPLVLLRNRKPRTLRPEFLWVSPLIIVLAIGAGLWGISASGQGQLPVDPISLLILAAGLGLGAAFGWQRGRMTTIHKEADGTLKAQASPIGLIIIIAVLVARRALEPWLQAHAADWHVNPLAIIEAFMLFAAGMVVTQRIEMFIRARNIRRGGADAHVEVEV
ncbi:DUF1453 domain-containing protein [Brevundimonas sp. FT23042]|uniref:DUF1453 domain-containing protein n=1 Tax=Brevundimonas sp. FT23042 TaxID=3393749 RepID=UPI003B587114